MIMFKRLLFGLVTVVLMAPSHLAAQGVVTKALTAATCPGDGCVSIGVEGFGSAAVQLVVSGTSTAVVEGTLDGRTWATIAVSASDGSGTVTSATATGAWFANVAGFTQVRVRLSAYTSGTVVAALQATRAGGGTSGGGGGGGDASAANQSTQITALQIIDNLPLAEDGIHASGESGILQLGVRNDAGTVLAADGDRIPLSMDSTGAVRVTGGGGGTQYTEGDIDASITGSALLFEGATNTLVAAPGTAVDGLLVNLGTNNDVVVTNAGTFATQVSSVPAPLSTTGGGTEATALRVTLANDSTGVVSVDDNGGALTVDGTVAVSGTVTVGSHAVTNAGTFATQVDGAALTALQLIDNLPNTIGSTTSGQSGVLTLGAVTTGAPTYTTAQSAGLSLDTAGSLRVAIMSGAGSGGTALADGATFTPNTTSLTPIGGMYESAVTACVSGDACIAGLTAQRTAKVTLYSAAGSELTPSTDATHDSAASTTGPQMIGYGSTTAPAAVSAAGDATRVWTGLNGQVATMLVDSAGAAVSVGGGTQYTQDAALTVATTVGTMAIGRASAAVPADVTADGDAVIPWYLRSGAQATQPTYGGVLAVAGNGVAGTGVQRVTLASDSTGNIASIGTSVTPGTAAANLGKAEDAVAASGDTGVAVLSVRQDVATQLAGTNGDYQPLETDAGGRLWVTATTLEDAVHTSGDQVHAIAGRRIDTLAASSGASGDYEMFNMSSLGALYTAPTATISGGADSLKYNSVGTTEDEHAVKASAGTLYSITATNTNAAVRFLRCANAVAASTTPGTTTPILDLAIPGAATGGGITFSFPVGVSFATALTCWTVTGAADTDVAEVAANELKFFYSFK